MMGKLVSFIVLLGMLFCKAAKASESCPRVRYAHEVKEQFIKEMKKKNGWYFKGSGGSMPFDIETITVMFELNETVSIETARKLIVSAIERFREIILEHEKIRPYLRNIPIDITSVSVFLYFVDKKGHPNSDGSVALACNDYKGDIAYEAYKRGQSYDPYYEIYRESYDEALKKLGIESPPHISIKKKARVAENEDIKRGTAEAKRISQPLAEKEQEILGEYGPGDEFKILSLSGTSRCDSIAEAIRELVTGVADKYFDEEFLKQVAQKQKESLNGEYVEYWPNGELKVRAYCKNGKIDGHLHGWYPNCVEAFKGYFSEGVRQGVHMVFFPLELRVCTSCDVRCYYYNEKGQLHGDQTVLYPGGRLKAFASYKNGVLDGEVLLFDTNRQKIKEWKYKRGKLVTKPKKSSA